MTWPIAWRRVLLAVALAWSSGACAQEVFPNRPLRLVALNPPGGPNDFLGRLLSERLAKTLGQPVIVENRVGGSGVVGTEYVARQPGDGHTLLIIAAAHVLNPSLMARLPYDPFKDFEPVTHLVSNTFSLTVSPSLGVQNLPEFLALARSRPGKITYASAGVGSAHHLSGELFKSMAKVDLLHVPYKGAGPILQALASNEVDATFIALFPILGQVKSGKLRTLAVTTAARSALLPDVPTLAESGLAGFDVDIWQGIVAPARTPQPVIARLNREMVAVVKDPQSAAKLLELGLEPAGSTPEQFLALQKADMAKWARVIRDAGIKAE